MAQKFLNMILSTKAKTTLALLMLTISVHGQANEYLRKIDKFSTLFQERMTEASEAIAVSDFNKLAKQSYIQSLSESSITVQNAVVELQSLYNKQFIDRKITPEEKASLVQIESDISIAVQQILHLTKKLVGIAAHGRPTFVGRWRDLQADFLAKKISNLTSSLHNRKKVPLDPLVGITQLLQAGNRKVSTACALVGGMCLQKSMTDLMNSLEAKNFFRTKDITFEGIAPSRSIISQSQKAVVIMIGNHDQPVYDIALAQRLSSKLGMDHHIIMTRKSVYPIPPPTQNGDIVYVVDNDPKSNPIKESIEQIKHSLQNKDKVSLAVYPEGMLPYTAGQMPMSTKEGAFVIARKLAAELALQNIPVLMVEFNTNIVRHLTDRTLTPALLNIVKTEFVPTTPMIKGQSDSWIDDRRIEAENRFNKERGERQLNIFDSRPIKNSMIPAASGSRCQRVFEGS
jgi:hypothetical protein